ncbi:MAG: DNA repair protein RecN [Oscillospiraceae bacterium]|nr:DNA repair protein RecN [Oscillospiraceae bacterium]
MLNLLHIENIAVIEQADILFDRGLNVLTGETGAGKSIVIDAISAILGERTYRDLIRTGCDKACVSAEFGEIAELPWFALHSVPYRAEQLLIRRELFADGRNLCRVNDVPVTVASLKELGRSLIQIHGQNDTQALFDEQMHLVYLDRFAADERLLTQYDEDYEAYVDLCAELERLTMDEGERLRRIETLRYQLQEIDRAELRDREEEELLSRRRILQNAERLSEGLSAATGALYGGDDAVGAIDMLSRAEGEISHLSAVDEKYAEFAQQIRSLREQAQELSSSLRDDADDLAYSADELEQIESRLEIIQRLEKKYGGSVAEVLSYAERSRAELDDIEDRDARLEIVQKKMAAAKETAILTATALRETRKAAAETLGRRIEEELTVLDMPSIRFSVEFTECGLRANGMDDVRFLMSANVGESMKPLSKAASGGELARIMLAMKNVLAETDGIPTMIFDEVDAGISGRAAQKVAEKLKAVSSGRQVLCVTHLPQIAAKADTHLQITKSVRDGRTYTAVTPLDRQGRVEELSRIIGGANITENTRRSAEDMLKA